MKVPECRVFVFCLVVAFFLAWPVYANPIEFWLTNFSIYQNDQPIENPINLSMKCYGTYNEYYLQKMGLPETWGKTNPELVFSYALSCEPSNCNTIDSHYPLGDAIISFCDLEGFYKGKGFFVKNYTNHPEPSCNSTVALSFGGYGKYKSYFGIFAINENDRTFCDTKYSNDLREKCDQFLEPDQSAAIGEHLHYTRNKTKYIATDEFIQCHVTVFSDQRKCYEKHNLINTTILEKVYPHVYCEKRIEIPPDIETSQGSFNQTRPPYTPQSLVESLYCTLQQFFGGKCE